jgi:hypothetical protein
VRAKQLGVEANVPDPIGDEPCVLPGRDASRQPTAAGEQKFAGLLAGASEVVINRLAGLFRQFESDGATGLFLPYRCPVDRVPARGDIFDLEGDDIAAALSIARLNIAKSRVRPSTCSLVRIDQTCFGRSGGFAPISLPLFQGVRFDTDATALSLSCMIMLLSYRK